MVLDWKLVLELELEWDWELVLELDWELQADQYIPIVQYNRHCGSVAGLDYSQWF